MATQIIDMEIMRGPILTVWNAIAGDLDTSVRDAGERLTNIAAVECCIDADRLTFFAHKGKKDERARAAEAELDRAIKAHGYDKVLRTLARHLSLV